MYITETVWWAYTAFVVAVVLFMLYFAAKVRQKEGSMDREERIWLGVLVVVFLLVNAITLSPVVPWQKWMLWERPTPQQQVRVEFADSEIRLPSQRIQVKAGEFIEFIAISQDVTYGFGVFRFWLWTVGSVLMTYVMGMAGSQGMLRRMLYPQPNPYQPFLNVAWVGGVLMALGFLAFLVNVIATLGWENVLGLVVERRRPATAAV